MKLWGLRVVCGKNSRPPAKKAQNAGSLHQNLQTTRTVGCEDCWGVVFFWGGLAASPLFYHSPITLLAGLWSGGVVGGIAKGEGTYAH